MRPDPDTDLFEAQRPRLLRLAYRMLGSRAEAEDEKRLAARLTAEAAAQAKAKPSHSVGIGKACVTRHQTML